jgi:hypothetical protein
MNKIFIIGLPRTGTTSVSVALLDYDFKVAHTAYTKHAFEIADVIADAPCFCDYAELDKIFPNSRFIYLDRALERWIPSIQMLLTKMLPELSHSGYLHPVLKRVMKTSFAITPHAEVLTQAHLAHCYQQHQQQVLEYFSGREDFLSINLSHNHSYEQLLSFLQLPAKQKNFPHVNAGKQVDSWKQLKHPNKVHALSAGKDHRQFFDYTTQH